MRVRALDANGDMTFGAGAQNFLVDSPQAVLQCVLTAMKLWQGEWFLDTTAGIPWNTQVLGADTQPLYDNAIRTAIRAVQGVTGISSYSSSFNPSTRVLTVSVTITTQFGPATLEPTPLQWAAPPKTGYGITPPTGPYGG
jgi:hypothetical protein